jgi:exosome complex RNA-binding protein Rrp42 (RNase PH superfamily)
MDMLQLLDPRKYVGTFVADGVRPDGRSFHAYRKVDVSADPLHSADLGTGSRASSSMIRLGGTSVVCRVQANADRTGSSSLPVLQINVLFPAAASPLFRSAGQERTAVSRPGFDTTGSPPSNERLRSLVHGVITASGLLAGVQSVLAAPSPPLVDDRDGVLSEASVSDDLSDAATPRPPVATTRFVVDLVFTAFDGNALDVAVLATVLALLRLPVSARDGPALTAGHTLMTASPAARATIFLPLPASFVRVTVPSGDDEPSVAATTGQLLLDPTCLEESVAASAGSVVLGVAWGHAAGTAAVDEAVILCTTESNAEAQHGLGGSCPARADTSAAAPSLALLALCKQRAAELHPLLLSL